MIKKNMLSFNTKKYLQVLPCFTVKFSFEEQRNGLRANLTRFGRAADNSSVFDGAEVII